MRIQISARFWSIFNSELKWKRSRAEPKILQLELWLEPARLRFKKMTHAWVWLVYFWNWNLKPRNLCHCLFLAFLTLLFIYMCLWIFFFVSCFFIHAHRVDTGCIENSFSYLLCPINTYQATRLDLCIAYQIWFSPCLSITFGAQIP